MGLDIDPENDIVVTIGSTEAMVDSIFALTNPGDKVVLFSPYFENYHAQVLFADCEPIYVPLVPPQFHFDPNVLEDAFRQHPKAIIICNPSNPSGKVFTEDELKLIAELCVKYDVYAIMDEVYEHIVYAPHKHVYMSNLPGMWERTVSCSLPVQDLFHHRLAHRLRHRPPAHHGQNQAVPRLQHRGRPVSADGGRHGGPGDA